MRAIGLAILFLALGGPACGGEQEALPANTWLKSEINFDKALEDYLDGKKGRWSLIDG